MEVSKTFVIGAGGKNKFYPLMLWVVILITHERNNVRGVIGMEDILQIETNLCTIAQCAFREKRTFFLPNLQGIGIVYIA